MRLTLRIRPGRLALCILLLLSSLPPTFSVIAVSTDVGPRAAVVHRPVEGGAHTTISHRSALHPQDRVAADQMNSAAVSSASTGSASAGEFVQSCQDVRSRDPQASDGNYVISPNGDSFVVYCYDMAGQPREYLPLAQTGSGSNYSRYASGGAVSGNDVVTLFTKVRIDPQTLVIDTSDLTFATSSGSISGANSFSSIPYATAADCRSGGSQTGTANIDLRGTTFIVHDSFASTGYEAAGSAQFSANNQIVNLTGGGYCGDEESTSGPGFVWCGCGGPSLHLQYVGPAGPAAPEVMGPGSASMDYKPCQQTRYPVNCVNGDFWHTFTDLSVPGRGIPLQFTRTYNALLASQDGPLGFGWTDSYSMSLTADSGNNLTVHEEAGSSVTFSPNGAGGYQAPGDVLATLVSSTDGSVYTYTRKDQEKFVFTAPTTTTSGLLTTEVDRDGYATTLSYSGGKLTTVTDPAGRSLRFSYNPAGRISMIGDPIGRTVVFTYDTGGNLTAAQDVGGGITRFTHDSSGAHRLLTMTDPNGGVVSNTYDGSGRVVAQTDPTGGTTAFTYTANSDGSQTTATTDPRGNVTTELYRNNLLVALTKGYGTPQQATWTYSYDPAMLGVALVSDPDGHTSYNTWDTSGNLLSHTDGLGRTTSYAYDALDDTTAITDPLGFVTTNTYDANGNLLAVSRLLTGTARSGASSGMMSASSMARATTSQGASSRAVATATTTHTPSRTTGAAPTVTSHASKAAPTVTATITAKSTASKRDLRHSR